MTRSRWRLSAGLRLSWPDQLDRVLPAQVANDQRAKVVTIWAHYAPYHLARIRALEAAGYDVVAFAISSWVPEYPFFKAVRDHHIVINDCSLGEVGLLSSFKRTFGLLRRPNRSWCLRAVMTGLKRLPP